MGTSVPIYPLRIFSNQEVIPMNTTNQTQDAVAYVPVNSAHVHFLVTPITVTPDMPVGYKTLYSQDYIPTTPDEHDVSFKLTIADLRGGDACDDDLDCIVAIGVDSDHELAGCQLLGRIYNSLKIHNSFGKKDRVMIERSKLFDSFATYRKITKAEGQRRTREEGHPKFTEHEAVKELLSNKHLDDLIVQATVLKEATDPLVRADAYDRIHFTLDRLHRIESAQYYNVGSRRRSREEDRAATATRGYDHLREERYGRDHDRSPRYVVDFIYNSMDDGLYTPEGKFIETKTARDARLWGSDAIADGRSARELTDEDSRDSRRSRSEDRYMREHGRRGRGPID